MVNLIVFRPANLDELAGSLGASTEKLRRLVRRYRIAPMTRIRGTAFYGEREIRRIWELTQAE